MEPPFIFAVSLDSERGNRPHIYSKEEILHKVVIEVSTRRGWGSSVLAAYVLYSGEGGYDTLKKVYCKQEKKGEKM